MSRDRENPANIFADQLTEAAAAAVNALEDRRGEGGGGEGGGGCE